MSEYRQDHHHNDVPGMCLNPELEKGRQQIQKLDLFFHFLLIDICPNVYMVYIGLPLLVAVTIGAGYLTQSAWPRSTKDLFQVALAGILALLTLLLAVTTICKSAIAFWHMNWFAKGITALAVLDLTRWRSLLGSPHDAGVDVLIAFAASVISETLWNAWRSRKPVEEVEELNNLG